MENGLLDAVGDILKPLCMVLPAYIHHSGDCVDGGLECVKLLLESYNRQNERMSKRVDRLKEMQRDALIDDYSVRLHQLFLGSGQGPPEGSPTLALEC